MRILHTGIRDGDQGVPGPHPKPTEDQVRHGLGGNLCRCGTYMGIRKAALEAAGVNGGNKNA